MHRNNIVIFRLKLLALAASLVVCPIASTYGQLAPGSEESDASKGPDPRLELEAEAKLPGVDPEMKRGAVRVDQTLLNDPSSNTATEGQPGQSDAFKEASQRAPRTFYFGNKPSETTQAEGMQAELAATRAELARTKEMVGEMLQEYKQLAEARELPPLKDAQVQVFQLKNTQAAVAAEKVELLFGSQPLRIAVDDASNCLIVFGKADAIPQVEQLVLKLDELVKTSPVGRSVVAPSRVNDAKPASRQTLLLRVFWLADGGVPDLSSAEEYLPPAVIDSLVKLGISSPQMVTQTVNSLAVEEGGSPMEFSTNVPAMLFRQPVVLISSGTLGATTDGRAEVNMQLSVGGAGVNCELKGSLATPLGHFMVLGTANSVIPEHQASDPAAGEGGGMPGMAMGMGPGAMDGGMMAGGGGGMAGGPPVKYNDSRFAFVVQVIEAESFEPAVEGE